MTSEDWFSCGMPGPAITIGTRIDSSYGASFCTSRCEPKFKPLSLRKTSVVEAHSPLRFRFETTEATMSSTASNEPIIRWYSRDLLREGGRAQDRYAVAQPLRLVAHVGFVEIAG